jgi:hypothetical protein
VAEVDPLVARRTYRTVEPCHAFVYFCPEAEEAYGALGLGGPRGYFASRSAPMGAVSAEVVVATFFNFNPSLVRRMMEGTWDLARPEALVAARLDAVDRAMRRILGGAVDGPEMARAAELARAAATAACETPEGRPLFAGHAQLPWPAQPHLVLWHAETLLREFRGDGHIAALVLDGCTGLDALVLHAATGEVPEDTLRATRMWPDEEWDAAVAGLVARGRLMPETATLTLTEEGARRRNEVEAATDRLAAPAYAAIGEEGCAELRRLARPFSQAVVAATFPAAGAPPPARL